MLQFAFDYQKVCLYYTKWFKHHVFTLRTGKFHQLKDYLSGMCIITWLVTF